MNLNMLSTCQIKGRPDYLIFLILGMKKIMIMFLSFIGTLQASAQQDDKILILNLLEDQRQAWNKGNILEFMQGYLKSDSLLFVGKTGPKYGWDTTLANYKKSYPDQKAMGFLSFDIKEVRMISDDYAFVLGAWHLKREKDDPRGYFTLIVKKIKGEWKVIADHSS